MALRHSRNRKGIFILTNFQKKSIGENMIFSFEKSYVDHQTSTLAAGAGFLHSITQLDRCLGTHDLQFSAGHPQYFLTQFHVKNLKKLFFCFFCLDTPYVVV
jgi:hypothetical protein